MGRTRRRAAAALDAPRGPVVHRAAIAVAAQPTRSAHTMVITVQPPVEAAIDTCPGDVVDLGDYHDGDTPRFLVAACDLHGGLLVIDQDTNHADPRLVAQLAPDEPMSNAQLVADLYRTAPNRHARRVIDDDWFVAAGTARSDARAALSAPD